MSSAEKMAAIKQSLRNIREKDPSTYSNFWSPITSEYLSDMERRFQRGRSEERYPGYYRGRSASPVSHRIRSRSAEPESFTYYEPTPSREVVSYTRSTSPVVYSRDYDFYYRPSYYYNYLTRPYYYDHYPYYKPYYYSSLVRPFYRYTPTSYYFSYYRPRYYSFYDYLPYRHLSSASLRYLLNLDVPYSSRYLTYY